MAAILLADEREQHKALVEKFSKRDRDVSDKFGKFLCASGRSKEGVWPPQLSICIESVLIN